MEVRCYYLVHYQWHLPNSSPDSFQLPAQHLSWFVRTLESAISPLLTAAKYCCLILRHYFKFLSERRDPRDWDGTSYPASGQVEDKISSIFKDRSVTAQLGSCPITTSLKISSILPGNSIHNSLLPHLILDVPQSLHSSILKQLHSYQATAPKCK